MYYRKWYLQSGCKSSRDENDILRFAFKYARTNSLQLCVRHFHPLLLTTTATQDHYPTSISLSNDVPDTSGFTSP